MAVEMMVGVVSLLGVVYLAWVQTSLRRSEVGINQAGTLESSAEAVSQLTNALMQAVEALADREALVADLRARIERLEESDRRKTQRIGELEAEVRALRHERDQLLAEAI